MHRPCDSNENAEDARVVEPSLLFCHSNAVEPAKHVAVCCEPDKRDAPFPLDFVEQPVVCELVDRAVEDYRCRRFPRPLLEGVAAVRHRLISSSFP